MHYAPAIAIAILAAAIPGAAAATTMVQSGVTAAGLSWQARSLIVGISSTDTAANGGNPIYNPVMPRHSGVARLSANVPGFGSGACTGTLLGDRRHIVTAAHCVNRGAGTASSAAARFYGGSDPDTAVSGLTGSSATHAVRTASTIFVHPDYTGQVVDQNDIAILRLNSAAPSWVTTYDIARTADLGLRGFDVAGYGLRSSVGGAVGSNLPAGILRTGDNRFEFRLGDPLLGGLFDSAFGTAPKAHSWLADFDNGMAGNDAACIAAGFCDPGVGAREVAVAPGDSGGPAFINNRLAALVSYGLSFGTAGGDVDGTLNSSFGEFSGYVPLALHRQFITSITGLSVPEPGSWAMLIAGFGLIGALQRRQRPKARKAH